MTVGTIVGSVTIVITPASIPEPAYWRHVVVSAAVYTRVPAIMNRRKRS